MNRCFALTAVAVGALALAGCATTANTSTQSVFAAQEALTTAEHAAVNIAPTLSHADVATLKHLDTQAYNAIVPLRAAAANGGATAIETEAASEALSALTAFLSKHQGA